jgi:hypothetical protein
VQLELFQGEHLPIFRARAALAEGNLRGAHEALGGASAGPEMARAAQRLARLERLLLRRSDSLAVTPDAVHAAFEEALEAKGEPSGDPIGAAGWFRLYAANMADALAAAPAHRFRGWCAMHFALAAGKPDAALAAAERMIPQPGESGDGWTWLEAARAAHAGSRNQDGNRWAMVACLTAREALDPAPPRLDPTGLHALDAPELDLPELPRALEELWAAASDLGLPEPACAWVPALGVLEGVFEQTSLRSSGVTQSTGFDLDAAAPADEPAPRAFLRALVAARDARGMGTGQPGRCGELELRARAAMKRAAPPLFERYLAGLGLYG